MKRLALMAAGIATLLCMSVTASAQGGVRQATEPGQKLTGTPPLEDYLVPASAEVAKPDQKGFIRRWLLLEPITKPNRSNTVFTDSYIRTEFYKNYFDGQFTDTPKDGMKVKAVVEEQVVDKNAPQGGFGMPMAAPQIVEKKVKLTWRAYDATRYNVKLYRLCTGLGYERYGILCWAYTVIDCPTDMENVRLSVGSNSASMWWVNGEEVLLLSNDRRMVADDAASKRINLKAGKNIIRGAVINGPGMSDFCVRILDENGNPVKNYTIDTK